jgi:hypothetical protein
MKGFRMLCLSSLGLLLFAGTALADYQPSQDTTLNLQVAPDLVQTSGITGQATFAAQEATHNLITKTTGQSVDHYYVWIYVNGEPAAAVDPLCGYDF